MSGTLDAQVVTPIDIGQPVLTPTAVRDDAQLVAVLDGLNGLHLLHPADASAALLDVAATLTAGVGSLR